MFNLIRYVFVVAVVVFVAYHYWPATVKTAGNKIASTTTAAARAGIAEASK